MLQTRIGEEHNYLSSGLVAAVRKADSKLVFIPVMFVLLRMWGTIQFFYAVALPKFKVLENKVPWGSCRSVKAK